MFIILFYDRPGAFLVRTKEPLTRAQATFCLAVALFLIWTQTNNYLTYQDSLDEALEHGVATRSDELLYLATVLLTLVMTWPIAYLLLSAARYATGADEREHAKTAKQETKFELVGPPESDFGRRA